MREIKIYNKEMIIVPKALRKRFTNLGDGVYIEKDGSRAGVFCRKTYSIQWLPEFFLRHFKKCLTI